MAKDVQQTPLDYAPPALAEDLSARSFRMDLNQRRNFRQVAFMAVALLIVLAAVWIAVKLV